MTNTVAIDKVALLLRQKRPISSSLLIQKKAKTTAIMIAGMRREPPCYCGEGQRGDQRMINGNKALLEHKQTGKAIRVFANDTLNAHVRYIGEFTLDEHQPYIVKKAHATNNGPERNVFEFCLHKKSK